MNSIEVLIKSAVSAEERVSSTLRRNQGRAEVEAQQLARLRGLLAGSARSPLRSAGLNGTLGAILGGLPAMALGRPDWMLRGAGLGAAAGAAFGATAPARTREHLHNYIHGDPMILAPSTGPMVEKKVPPRYLKMMRQFDG